MEFSLLGEPSQLAASMRSIYTVLGENPREAFRTSGLPSFYKEEYAREESAPRRAKAFFETPGNLAVAIKAGESAVGVATFWREVPLKRTERLKEKARNKIAKLVGKIGCSGLQERLYRPAVWNMASFVLSLAIHDKTNYTQQILEPVLATALPKLRDMGAEVLQFGVTDTVQANKPPLISPEDAVAGQTTGTEFNIGDLKFIKGKKQAGEIHHDGTTEVNTTNWRASIPQVA